MLGSISNYLAQLITPAWLLNLLFKFTGSSFYYIIRMSSSAHADGKTTEPANPDYINLKVKSQEGEEIYFKIKKTTSFKKLMDTYCQRANVRLPLFSFPPPT